MSAAALIAYYPGVPLDIRDHDDGSVTAVNRETGIALTEQQILAAIAAYVPPLPKPTAQQVTMAFNALLTSAVYARVSQVSNSSNAVLKARVDIATGLTLGMGGNFYTEALNAAIAELDTALTNSALLGANSLTNAEKTWISNWNTTHSLGLDLPWD